MLQRLIVAHRDTTNYSMTIGVEGLTQRTENWQASGPGSYLVGGAMSNTGTSSWLVLGDARKTSILIECNNAGTVTVSAVEYHLDRMAN